MSPKATTYNQFPCSLASEASVSTASPSNRRAYHIKQASYPLSTQGAPPSENGGPLLTERI
jgi:hypothetical protein